MSKRIDHEKSNRESLANARGRERSESETPLTPKQKLRLQEGVEKRNARAKRLVIELKESVSKMGSLPVTGHVDRQIVHLQWLYSQLSAEDKRRRAVGGFLKSCVKELKNGSVVSPGKLKSSNSGGLDAG